MGHGDLGLDHVDQEFLLGYDLPLRHYTYAAPGPEPVAARFFFIYLSGYPTVTSRMAYSPASGHVVRLSWNRSNHCSSSKKPRIKQNSALQEQMGPNSISMAMFKTVKRV